ncbi:hypothetical protein D3C72_1888960 [compost metagenome]
MNVVVGKAIGTGGVHQLRHPLQRRERRVADRLGAGGQVVELGSIEIVAPLRARGVGVGGQHGGHAAQQAFVLQHALAQRAAGLSQQRVEMLLRLAALEPLRLQPCPCRQQRAAGRDQQ